MSESEDDYTAIRCTNGAKSEADEAREPGETWNEYVRRCAENPPEVINVVRVDEIRDELASLSIDADDVDLEGSDLTADDVAAAAERGVEKALQNASMA